MRILKIELRSEQDLLHSHCKKKRIKILVLEFLLFLFFWLGSRKMFSSFLTCFAMVSCKLYKPFLIYVLRLKQLQLVLVSTKPLENGN